MLKSAIEYRVSLYLKELEYKYITFKNNRELERAFIHGSAATPIARAISFTKNYPVALSLLTVGIISISLITPFKSVDISKQASSSLESDKEIYKKLTKAPTITSFALNNKETKPHSASITPFAPDSATITRNSFINKQANFTLLVNKNAKKILVTQENKDGYLIVDEFPISLGLVSGNKQFEGDKKTPEGIYSLIDLKTDAELPGKYGPYAAVLNYPNKEDLRLGKTGSGIWIHGTGKNSLTPDTQGCVELSDGDLIKLYPYIGKGTKIIIAPENVVITPKKNIVQKNIVKSISAS